MADVSELIQVLKRLGVVANQEVTLSHAGKASKYIDIKKAYGNPIARDLICSLIAEQIDSETECLAGSGHGGITLASILSDRRYSNLSLVRVDSKGHGIGKSIDGYVPHLGDILEIADDVYTTGGSLKKIYDILASTGAIVKAAHVVVKRNDLDIVETRLPFPVTYLIKATDLF